MSDIDSHLEMEYEDRFHVEDMYDGEDDGRYDDDPSPYDGTYSEE